jgi:hypothetical protein
MGVSLMVLIKQFMETHSPVSLVLLYRQPRCYDEEELRVAAKRAWRVSFSDNSGSSPFVVQSDGRAVLHVGCHMISLLSVSQRYSTSTLKNLHALQQEAWTTHVAWTALDYIKGNDDIELQYCVLAKFAAELIDTSCVGVYAPRESSLIPNDTDLYDEFQKIASARETGLT